MSPSRDELTGFSGQSLRKEKWDFRRIGLIVIVYLLMHGVKS